MNINVNKWYIQIIMNHIQRYNPKKYWKRRNEVINPNSKVPKIIRFYWLYWIKKSDAFQNASLGTDFGKGATFANTPCFPHHLNGIIITHGSKIGENCTIFQQVTIGLRKGLEAPVIGDNVVIGAGAKILGAVTIANNVKIGANPVVVKDILEPNTTWVGVPARKIGYRK